MPEPGAELRVPRPRTDIGLPVDHDVYADWDGTEFGEEIHFVSYAGDSDEESAEASTWIGSSCSPYQCESQWSLSSRRRNDGMCNRVAREVKQMTKHDEMQNIQRPRLWDFSLGSPRHRFRANSWGTPPKFRVPLRRWRPGDRERCQERPLPLLIRAPHTIRVHSGQPFAVAGPAPTFGISGSAIGDSDKMHSVEPPLLTSLESHVTEHNVVPFDVMLKAGMVESRSTASSGSEFDIDEVDIDEELSDACESSDGEVQLEDSVDIVDDQGCAD